MAAESHTWGRDFFVEVAEEFRRLCVALQASGPSLKSVLVTAPKGGEGATTVAVNLARALAEKPGSRILLVDANGRDPVLHHLFGVDLAPGLRDYDGYTGLVYRATPAAPNLFVLPAGAGTDDAAFWAEQSTRLRAIAKEVRDTFDFIVWDSPPVAQYPDAIVLAKLVDGVLVVVEGDQTRTDTLRFVRDQLVRAEATVLGAVLNRRGQFIPRFLRPGSKE